MNGREFDGWYREDPACSTSNKHDNFDRIYGDTKLYAKWKITSIGVESITFSVSDASHGHIELSGSNEFKEKLNIKLAINNTIKNNNEIAKYEIKINGNRFGGSTFDINGKVDEYFEYELDFDKGLAYDSSKDYRREFFVPNYQINSITVTGLDSAGNEIKSFTKNTTITMGMAYDWETNWILFIPSYVLDVYVRLKNEKVISRVENIDGLGNSITINTKDW